MQAWGAYGTFWPVIHQQLGARPDMGRNKLTVVTQVLPGSSGLSGENIRVGDGSVTVSADQDNMTYTTRVSTALDVDPTIGHTIPREAKVRSARLNGEDARYAVRNTNRGREVFVDVPTTGAQVLVVEIQ